MAAGTLAWPTVVARSGPEKALANYVPAEVPFAGRIISMFMSLVTLCVLSVCFVRRVQRIHNWFALPLAAWLIVIIYVDSFLFVFVTALFKDIGLNSNPIICEGAILLCLICYMSTKIFIYCFLVEKAYIVRGKHVPRLKDMLYLCNSFLMLLPYTIVVILNFVWRISYINTKGTCIIGMERRAMMPLIIFDVAVNVYMTALFIVPLRRLYSYKNNQSRTLHNMAFRTFVGSCATLTSSVANLTVLMVLRGEPGWICLLCCNADILFSVLVLHWATSGDQTGQTTNRSTSSLPQSANAANATARKHHHHRRQDGGPVPALVGMETIISRHYQDAANNWPSSTKAEVNASCAPVVRTLSTTDAAEAIAMNKIMVTHERSMVVVSSSGGEEEDGRSETTTAGGGGEMDFQREGSTDGMIVERGGLEEGEGEGGRTNNDNVRGHHQYHQHR